MKLNRDLQEFAENYMGRPLESEEKAQLQEYNDVDIPSEEEIPEREMLVGIPNMKNLIAVLKAFQ